MCWRALCVLGLPAIGLFAVLIASRTAPAADSPAAIEVQESLQIPLEQRRRIVRGEAVSFPVAENSEREIAAGVALTLPAPFSQLAEYLSSGQLIAQDATIGDFGLVPPEAHSSL